VVYSPPSGTVFQPGTTNVVDVTALDSAGNPRQCQFRVIINKSYGYCVPFPPWMLVDSDGDGVPDWQELAVGTDPNDPQSVFRVSAIKIEGNDVRVWWPALGGLKYQLEGCSLSSLNPSNYVPVAPVLEAVGPFLHTTNTVDLGGATNKPARFYRVRLVP